MDVTLVLTHRCNLNCGYCYAGEHHKTDMDPETVDRAVELLFSDKSQRVQLSFFGGEPLLAYDAMNHAVARARARCAQEGRELVLQCTTNGAAIREKQVAFFAENNVRVTVSIDGVPEAHDLNRPKAGGGSSFNQVHGGLRQLIAAGQRPDAMMVITPETAPYVYRSVSFLWTEGVGTVRANVALAAPWGRQEKDELTEQLTSVGIELAGRRLRGETVRFEPFEAGMAMVLPARGRLARRASGPASGQVVVGVSGNLYPCAPMVGEDRDDGPEAAMRMGHISAGPAAMMAKMSSCGASCSDGDKCACAAYLETGDRDVAGPMGLWYARTCKEIGRATALGIRDGQRSAGREGSRRRPFLLGMAAAATGLAVGVPIMIEAGLFGDRGDSGCSREPDPEIAGGISAPPEPPPDPPVPGQLAAPVPPEPPPPDVMVDGGLGPPPEPMIKGDIAAPPEPPPPQVRGQISRPTDRPTKEASLDPDILGDLL